jgi:uncharacterized protein (TIGR00369 family)
MSESSAEQSMRRWRSGDPKRVVGRGHPVGDYLEAYDWEVLEQRRGHLRLRVQLPQQVMNPRGELFGGFTSTYADFASLFVFHTAREPDAPPRWLSTAHLRVDYFAPISGPQIELVGEVVNFTGRTGHVQIRFFDGAGQLCAIAQTTLIEQRD